MKGSTFLLWKGHCSVHARFTVRHIENIRAQHPSPLAAVYAVARYYGGSRAPDTTAPTTTITGGTITDTEPPVDIMELISKYAFGDVEKKPTKEKK